MMKNMIFSCNLCGQLSQGRGKYWGILLGTWCLLGNPRPPHPPDNAAGSWAAERGGCVQLTPRTCTTILLYAQFGRSNG